MITTTTVTVAILQEGMDEWFRCWTYRCLEAYFAGESDKCNNLQQHCINMNQQYEK